MLAQPEETVNTVRSLVPWSLRDVGLTTGWIIAVVLATTIVLGIVLVAGDFGDDAELAGALGITLALEASMLVATAWFTVRRYGCGWEALGFRPARSGGWWMPLAMAGAVLGASYVALNIYSVILKMTGAGGLEPESTIPDESFDSALLLPLVIVLAMIAAPVAEEVFFRGFLFPALRGRWGALWAALASALLFAALHFDPGSFVPFTVIGLLLAWAYVVSGSLWAAILPHFAFNSISVAVGIAAGGGS
jgi:membrane protease YdiL (CAAX protease family)